MKEIDYKSVSDNPKVIELLKERRRIELEIMEIDRFALILLEFLMLNIED